jgi:type IV pilus assembly protein PilC
MEEVKHKQPNFFLHFFEYVCLGAYYIINFFISKIINGWKAISIAFYDLVNQNKKVDIGEEVKMGDKSIKTETKSENVVRVNYSKQDETSYNQGVNGAKIFAGQERTRVETMNKSEENERKNLQNAIEAGNEVRSAKPVTYQYQALSPDGKKVKSTFMAYSKTEVYNFLENEGYQVYSIKTSGLIELLYGPSKFASSKIKIKDIVFWLEQLSTYLKAGIPLTDAMRILTKQMGKNGNIGRTFNSIVYNLTLGESFSTCLERQGEAFPTLLINMIKSAEATGDLEGTLDEMAEYYRQTETTRKEMMSALTYPIMVMFFSIGVVIFMLLFLVPKFKGIYEQSGAKINSITLFLLGASDFLKANLLNIIIIIFVIIGFIIIVYKNIKAFRYWLQSIAMRIPVLGNIIIYKEMMIFTKTFASLLKNNVFITKSIDILGKITNNEIYREIMINTINCIGRGDKISTAFKNHWAIPEVAYYMMVTGESTGELGDMMEKVSNYYAEQHRVLVTSIKNLIEPVLIIFLAVVVGGIVISIIYPMFGLYSEIMK